MSRHLIIPLIISIFFLSSLTAQIDEFASVGTEWHYGSSKFVVTNEIIIEGKNCKRIEKQYGFSGCYIVDDEFFIYENEGAVSFYKDNTFYPLYDFSLGEGDTLYTHFTFSPYEENFILIDSVAILDIGGVSIKAQYLKPFTSVAQLGYIIYENIGPDGFLFPGSGVCDPIFGEGLNCFYSGDFGIYLPPPGPPNWISVPQVSDGTENCIIVSNSEIDNINSSIQVYPNPSSDFIIIDSNLGKQIQVYNISGKLLLEKKLDSSNELDISILKAGIYLISVKSENGGEGYGTFVKL